MEHLEKWRKFIDTYIRESAPILNGSILEIGLGDSTFTLKDMGVVFDVCDIRPEEGVNIIGDVHNLSKLILNKYDVIICAEVFEHTKKPWIVAKEIEESVVDGGYIIITVPCNLTFHAAASEIPYGDYWRFLPQSVPYMFDNCNLTKTSVCATKRVGFPAGICYTFRKR